LKGFSDYLFSKYDYLNALKYRIESLQVLSQATDSVSAPH
jgi:hypothetical protein